MPLDYVLRRLGIFVLVVWLTVTVNFFLPRLPQVGAELTEVRQQIERGEDRRRGAERAASYYERLFGLNRPVHEQYLLYLGDLARLDFGYSMSTYPKTVREVIADSIPWTLGLVGFSTLLGFGIGTLAGALLAWPKAPHWLGYLTAPFLILSAIPFYLLGLALAYVFAFQLRWLPIFGGHPPLMIPNWSLEFIVGLLRHATLPAASIILSAIGTWALGMRATMVMTLGEDYMALAEAKGLKERTVMLRYAVRNALLPQTTALAISMGQVVSGAVLVEAVFSYPGIGGLLYYAIRQRDYFLLQGIVFLIILSIALVTLLLDLALPLVDPRISYRRA